VAAQISLRKKEKRLSLGVYPDISLAAARERRDAARTLLANGVDPGAHRKATKAARAGVLANSFEVVAREWHAKQKPTWSADYADKVIQRLERDVFPWIGKTPIADLKVPELLKTLRRIESRSLETAHRALQNCGQVFRYAIQTGRIQYDITPGMRGALTPWRPVHFASITEPTKIGPLLRDLYSYRGTFGVQSALQLAPLVFLRPGELRFAKWSEFDLDDALWNVPGPRMKMKEPHVVPLSRQALEILRELHPLTGSVTYVFAVRSKDKPMSESTVNKALRKLGYSTNDEFTGHGVRPMARTVLDEVLGFPVDVIEHQLAHAVIDANGRAYNRTTFLPERRHMMQVWSDYLEKLRLEAESNRLGPGK
jgi:integrase